MDDELIFARFATLCGLNSEEAEAYRFLCRDAAARLESAASSKEVVAANSEPFCAAAAAAAAYNYFLIGGGGDVSSFKAGDVSLSLSTLKGASSAREYLDVCMENIKSFLKDEDFIFEAIYP